LKARAVIKILIGINLALLLLRTGVDYMGKSMQSQLRDLQVATDVRESRIDSVRKLRVRLEQIDMLHNRDHRRSTVDIQSRIQDLKFEEKRLLTMLLGQQLERKQTLTERLQLLDVLEVIGDLLMWIAAGVLGYYLVRWW